MIGITASLDLRDLDKGIRGMKVSARDLKTAFRQAAPEWRKDIRDHGKKREGPDAKWEPLAASTKAKRKARRRAGKKVAVAVLGKLRTAFGITFARDHIEAKSKIPWAGVHFWGGTAGKGAKIPSRDWLYASDDFMVALVRRIRFAIIKGFAR